MTKMDGKKESRGSVLSVGLDDDDIRLNKMNHTYSEVFSELCRLPSRQT